MCSGEALPVGTAAAFLRKFPNVTLSNVLSTTETSADICCVKHVTAQLLAALPASPDALYVPVLDSRKVTLRTRPTQRCSCRCHTCRLRHPCQQSLLER